MMHLPYNKYVYTCVYYQLAAPVNKDALILRHVSAVDNNHLQGVSLHKGVKGKAIPLQT